MGITGTTSHNLSIRSIDVLLGLLPLLKSIHKHCNLKKFAGQTIGVDAYGWLHRGTVACAIDLALDKPTTK
jgi:exonuclease-1